MTTEAQLARAPGTEEITRLLAKMREGDPKAEEELLSRVYHELRSLAASMMAREAPGHTLQPTALVDEAWLRLFGHGKSHYPDRAYFFAAAGEAMRRILVEVARRKKREKHGGELRKMNIEDVELVAPDPDDELLAVDEVLNRFAELDSRAAQVVKLLYFVRLTQAQAAQELGVSLATVGRDWGFARAWLKREIQRSLKAPN